MLPGAMDASSLAAALEELASRLGVQVRYDAFDAKRPPEGGLCHLYGKPIVLLDRNLAPSERVAVLARALAPFDLEPLFVTPLVRATIRAYAPVDAPAPPQVAQPLARALRPPPDDEPE